VAKWRKRASVEDLKTGPKEPRSTIPADAEEAMIVAFRRHTLLPLDDCLHAFQPSIAHLTRGVWHRCLQRHGSRRLPDLEGDKSKRQKSGATRSASSTSTSPRRRPQRANSISWLASSARARPLICLPVPLVAGLMARRIVTRSVIRLKDTP